MQSISDDAVLEVRDVAVAFGGVQALDGVTLSAGRGRITGLIGPNGAGKSTLFNAVSGLVRPRRGRVLLGGRDVTGLPAHRMARFGLVRTFQIARELSQLTVLENLLLARPRQRGERVWRSLAQRRAVAGEERAGVSEARALLERVGLWSLADAPAATLSGGQKKLIELTRALMARPRLILLDEPAAGVNPALMRELSRFILALRDEGISFVIIEHDMDVVASVCDPVYVLAEGRTLARGSFAEISQDRRVRRAYLGGV